MQSSSSPPGDSYNASQSSPTRRLKLSMPSAVSPITSGGWHSGDINIGGSAGRTTPPQPTWSPLSQPDFPNTEQSLHEASDEPTWIEEPAAQPLNLDENPDAIALRAAISILQLQRQQSLKHIQALDKMKHAALHDPESFVEHLKQGKLSEPPKVDVDVDDVPEEDEDESVADDVETSRSKQGAFGTLPALQNVVRCPPVNWDKYHVVGESLDRMHAEQRKYPGVTDAEVELFGHPNEHKIAAPYQPFTDRLEEKTGQSQGPGS